jgi:hypothetical protein
MGIPKGIGLDLDNTVIDYTPAYRATAARMGLPPEFTNRKSIRPLLRRSEVDDLEWQRFQALLYTDGLAYAKPAAGLRDFLNLCAELPVRVFIVIEVLEHSDLPIDIRRFHYQLEAPVFDIPELGVQPANFTSLTTWLASC